MLVQCSCGNQLRVRDALVGKRVRCPKCEEIVLVEEADTSPEEEPAPARKRRPAPADDEDEPPRRRTAARGRASDDEEEDERPARSSRRQRPEEPEEKGGSPLRTIIGAVVLCVLLGVGAWLFWNKFSSPGIVKLEIPPGPTEVFVNGKKMDYSVPAGASEVTLTLDLQPGNHDLKVTRNGFQPFTRQVTVKSGETEVIQVRMQRVNPGDG